MATPKKTERVQELRRSSASQPHRNRKKYHRPSEKRAERN